MEVTEGEEWEDKATKQHAKSCVEIPPD